MKAAQRQTRSFLSLRPWRPLRWMLSGLLILAAGCGGGEPKHVNWSNATGAEQYERLMWKAIHDKDWKTLEHRLSPTFVGTTAAGEALDKAAWIEHWKASPVTEFSLGEVAVHPSGPDMVVTYVLSLSGAAGASQPAPSLRVISVWQAVKGGWVLTTTAATPIRT